MPSRTAAVPDIAPADLAWLKSLAESGIGTWDKGNRPLKADEFERIKRLIAEHDLPCSLQHDAHDVLFVSIHIPPPVPDIKPEEVLMLAFDNFPGFDHNVGNKAYRAFRDQADGQILAMTRTPRNRDLLKLYKIESER